MKEPRDNTSFENLLLASIRQGSKPHQQKKTICPGGEFLTLEAFKNKI